jgi:hypothetical protein
VASEFVLHHPDDWRRVLRYGLDDHGCAWAELTSGSLLVRYEAACGGYDDEEPVRGLLTMASQWGFVGADEIIAARRWLRGLDDRPPEWPGRRRRAPRRLRSVLRIVENLERADG